MEDGDVQVESQQQAGQDFHEQETQEYQHEIIEGQEYQEGVEYQQEGTEGQEYQQQILDGEEYQQQEGEGAEYQQQETQVFQIEGQEYYQQPDGQEYHQIIEGEGQEYQQQEGEYQQQEGQEYHQVIDGQEYQEGVPHEYVEYQEYNEGGEQPQHEMETQIIDGSTELDQNAIHDLIAFHSVDSEGNIITDVGGVHVEGTGVEVEQAENNVEMTGNEVGEHYTEYVEGSQEEGHEQDNSATSESSSFLNIQEAIFNPNTGTLEPIRTTTATNDSTTITKAQGKTIRRSTGKVQKRGKVQSQSVKFMIPGEGGQQILLDAQTLQGLLKGGGNTITLSGASGKQSILIGSGQKNKLSTGTTRSPAKILPAPVPVGDQQQAPSKNTTGTKYLLKQGNVLTPISAAMGQSLGGSTKIIQMQAGGSNQVQYVRLVSNKQIPSNKIPIAPSRPKTVAPRPPPGGQTIFSLPSGSSSDMNSLQGSGLGNFVVLPSSYMIKNEPNTPVPIRPAESSSSSTSTYNGILDSTSSILGSLGQGLSGSSSGNFESFRSLLEPNGMRPRKPCNCTKSQCLKLYCDCFANGEFCHLCNCNNCFNNLNHEEERQKAIKLVLERNPGAFRPKIGKSSQTGEAHERRHNKGCNCRRSGCLKNYCECYEAKIFCSGICKCSGCKNCIENIPSGLPNDVGVEQHFAGAGTSHRQTLKDLAEAAEVRVQQQNQVRNKMKAQMQDVSPQNNLGNMVPPVIFRYPNGSISYEVVTSIVELLLAKVETGERHKLTEGDLERLALEEFGDCLGSVMELGTTVGHLDD